MDPIVYELSGDPAAALRSAPPSAGRSVADTVGGALHHQGLLVAPGAPPGTSDTTPPPPPPPPLPPAS